MAEPKNAPNTLDLQVVDDLLTTTRAVRRRLDYDRPVERSVILDCIRQAQQAPTGGNAQGWRWIVVEDAVTRAALADIYRRAGESALAPGPGRRRHRTDAPRVRLGPVPDGAPSPRAGTRHPLHHRTLARAADQRQPRRPLRLDLPGGVVVSARAAGARSRLGSVLTTVHLGGEADAAALLGVPAGVQQVGLLPVAYTTGGEWRPAARPPATEIVHIDRWQ